MEMLGLQVKYCDWCDGEFDIGDTTINCTACEEHENIFCSNDCLNEHLLNEKEC